MLSFGSNQRSVTISPSVVVFGVFLVLFLYFLFFIRSILTLLFLAFIVMVALNPAVTGLEKRLRIPRALSTALVYLVVFGLIATLLAWIVPTSVQQLYLLVRAFDIPFLQDEIRNIRLDLSELSALAGRVGDSVGFVFSLISSTFAGIFTAFTLIVMSFYLMLDRPYLHLKVKWFTKRAETVKLAKEFLDSVESQLGGWVRGQFILMLVIGLVTYLGLLLLGVPYALPLAVVAGLLEIVPNLGPTLAAVPSIILAYLTMGPVSAGLTVLFYIIVQQLENNIIVPKILKDNADVNPLVAIVTILIGLQVGGVIGALLSVPAYIVLRTLYSLWLREYANR